MSIKQQSKDLFPINSLRKIINISNDVLQIVNNNNSYNNFKTVKQEICNLCNKYISQDSLFSINISFTVRQNIINCIKNNFNQNFDTKSVNSKLKNVSNVKLQQLNIPTKIDSQSINNNDISNDFNEIINLFSLIDLALLEVYDMLCVDSVVRFKKTKQFLKLVEDDVFNNSNVQIIIKN